MLYEGKVSLCWNCKSIEQKPANVILRYFVLIALRHNMMKHICYALYYTLINI